MPCRDPTAAAFLATAEYSVDQKLIPGVVLIVSLVACAAGWVMLPALQSADASVDAQASVHLERARRIAHGYSHGLSFKSLLLDRMAELGVNVYMEDADELLEEYADEYQNLHQDRWDAYQPYDFSGTDMPPSTARAGYGNIPRQVRDGISARENLLAENDKGLDQALAEINEAMSVTAGDASARSHAEANRLKGVVLTQQAIATRLSATIFRRQAMPLRNELRALGAKTVTATGSEAAAGADQTSALKGQLAATETILAEKKAALSSLDRQIAGFESRLADARGRADAARATINDLKIAGIDFSRADGAEAFQAALTEADRSFRAADAEARALEFGTLPNARIDNTGDFLTGSYVDPDTGGTPNTEPGLKHYQRDRAVLGREVELGQVAVDGFRSDISRLEGLAAALAAEGQSKERTVREARERAGEVFTDLSQLESEAYAAEDDAVALLDQAARAFRTAAQGANDWIADGRTAASNLSSPAAKGRSAHVMQSEASWMAGHIQAQQADALIEKSRIYRTRFKDQSRTAAALSAFAEPLGLREADPDAELAAATEAHDAAVDEIDQAVRLLQSAFNGANRHWTFVAQMAAVNELMAGLGHAQYTADAVETYRSAIDSRRDDPAARPFVARLEELEARE